MARTAREKTEYGTFLIKQSCIPGKKIFSNDGDRKNFLKILMQKKRQFNFRLYGCCVTEDDGYKLLIYDNGSDISNIMKSINISLVMNILDGEKVFSERYRSDLIKSTDEFKEIYFSFGNRCRCGESFPEIYNPLIDSEIYFTPPGSGRENVLLWDRATEEFCLEKNPQCRETGNCIKTVEQGLRAIEKSARKQNMDLDGLLKNKKVRNEMLLRLRKASTLSLRELGEIFGGLSESAVCKIISRSMER